MKINYLSILFLMFFPIMGYSNGLTVVVMDTGVNAPSGFTKICKEYNTTEESDEDLSGHGTNVIGLIAKNAGKSNYCIYSIKAFETSGKDKLAYINALKLVQSLKPDILNISAGGSSIIHFEIKVIKSLLDSGTRVVAAAGNDGNNLNDGCNFYPACNDDRIIVVGNVDISSNYGDIVDFVIDGNEKAGFGVRLSGSSQSTAIYTGRLIKELSK